MKLTSDQIDFINSNEWVIFATASETAIPRAAIVIPSRVTESQIILSNVQMGRSAQNVHENAQVFVSSYQDDRQVKISGMAKYFSSGDIFDAIQKFEQSRDIEIQGIIVIDIQNIEETVEK